MRIAMLVHSLDGIGGVSKHALTLAREFVAAGHHVGAWAVEHNRALCYPELTEQVPVVALRYTPHLQSTAPQRPFGLRMLSYLVELTALYRDQRRLAASIPGDYDVINPHGYGTHWAAAAYKREHHAPVVWMSNDFCPIAHYDAALAGSPLEALAARAKAGLTWGFARYDRRAVRHIDRVLVLNHRVQEQMAQHYQVDSEIVRTGVDSRRFAEGNGDSIRHRYDIAATTFVILTVALMMPRRRFEDVIEAVRLLTQRGIDVVYLIVGRTSYDEGYAQALRDRIRDGGLTDRVHFAGEVSESALVDHYHASDAFVWAADESQSWGMAALEAMSAGKPLIVSEANGIAEAVAADETALIVPARDAQAIARAIERLMAEPGLAERIGQGGRTLVNRQFSWQIIAEQMLHAFEAVIDWNGTDQAY